MQSARVNLSIAYLSLIASSIVTECAKSRDEMVRICERGLMSRISHRHRRLGDATWPADRQDMRSDARATA